MLRPFFLFLLLLVAAAPPLPEVTAPLRTGVKTPQDAAVVIGAGDYMKVSDVPFAREDAEAFQNFLLYTRGIPPGRVHLIESDVSRENILDALDALGASVRSGGVAWVYFAGHGAASPTTAERMVLGDDVSSTVKSMDGRGIALSEMEARAGKGGGRVMMVIDACYAGVGRDGGELIAGTRLRVPVDMSRVSLESSPLRDAAMAARTTEWLAVDRNEVSGVMPGAEHGAFTYLVTGALRGWADGELDAQRDGVVTLDEADVFVRRALAELGVRTQHPVILNPPEGFRLSTRVKEVSPVFGAVAPRAVTDPPAREDDLELKLSVARPATPEKACDGEAAAQATAARRRQMETEVQKRLASASASWQKVEGPAVACLDKAAAEREGCAQRVDRYVEMAVSAVARLQAGDVRVSTACGQRTRSFPEETAAVAVPEIAAAKLLARRLRGGAAEVGAGISDKGMPGVGDEVVWVPDGTFLMGALADGSDRDDTAQARRVTVKGFYMATTEVTQALWDTVVAGEVAGPRVGTLSGQFPVQNVSWCDVLLFANRLSVAQGLKPVYSGVSTCARSDGAVTLNPGANGWRLPTEVEWEYAARGGTTLRYGAVDASDKACSIGNVADQSAALQFDDLNATVSCDDGYAGPAPVGAYAPNGYGLYDMVGNVWEWTWDLYEFEEDRGSTSRAGPVTEQLRVIRGGAWNANPAWTNVAYRFWGSPTLRWDYLGVRLARSGP